MKTKNILLTLALVIFSLTIKAQDKYEFIIIQYSEQASYLTVSASNATLTEERIELPKNEKYFNGTPFLTKVKEYQDKGWEVMSFNNIANGNGGNVNNLVYFGYLRKKKID